MNILREPETFPNLQEIDTGTLVPDQEKFRVSLHCLQVDAPHFVLFIKDDWTEVDICLKGRLTKRELPEFLIHSDYFIKGRDSPEHLWREAVAQAITKFAKPKLVIRKKGAFLKVSLSFGAVKLRGQIPWEKAKKLFEE